MGQCEVTKIMHESHKSHAWMSQKSCMNVTKVMHECHKSHAWKSPRLCIKVMTVMHGDHNVCFDLVVVQSIIMHSHIKLWFFYSVNILLVSFHLVINILISICAHNVGIVLCNQVMMAWSHEYLFHLVILPWRSVLIQAVWKILTIMASYSSTS